MRTTDHKRPVVVEVVLILAVVILLISALLVVKYQHMGTPHRSMTSTLETRPMLAVEEPPLYDETVREEENDDDLI